MTFVLAVSIIGIPLLALVPVALLALLIGSLLGFVAVARNLGQFLEERFDRRAGSAVVTVVLGIVAIQALSLLGRAVALPGGWLGWIGLSLLAAGFFFKYTVWTIGMGATTLVLLGRDWRRPTPPAAIAPVDDDAAPVPDVAPAADEEPYA